MDSCDDKTHEELPGKVTWWLADTSATGEDDAFVTVKFSCDKTVNKVLLKNTGSGAGTHGFRWVVAV